MLLTIKIMISNVGERKWIVFSTVIILIEMMKMILRAEVT